MIAASVKAILASDVTLTTDIADALHVMRRPRGAGLPSIVLRTVYARPLDQLDGKPSDDQTNLQLDVLTDDESGGEVLMQRVGDRCRTLLEGYQGSVGDHYINGCTLETDIETIEPRRSGSDNWIRKRSQTYRITATNNVARL